MICYQLDPGAVPGSSTNVSARPRDGLLHWDYNGMMDKQLRGVNLGGWLVLEKWIAKSLFAGTEATDEYTLCQELGSSEAERRLTKHREAFITEDHIKQIKALDLSVVRFPVGYWLFGGVEPFVDGADRYVDKLFEWTSRHDLKVILDFHAAPGSQNGWDHSGRSGEINWNEPDNTAASLAFVERLASRYGHQPNLVGIEPLNEPHWDVELSLLVDYYRKAAEIIQSKCHAGVSTIVSDAFRPEQMSKALRKVGTDVVLDIHLYQLFTPEDRALDLTGHLNKTKEEWDKLIKKLTKHHMVLVGEWSAAMSELYNQLNEPQRKYDSAAYEQYAKVQQDVFNTHRASWTYWTARTEDGGVWSLLDHPYLLG